MGIKTNRIFLIGVMSIIYTALMTGCKANGKYEDPLKPIMKEESLEAPTKLTMILFGEALMKYDDVLDQIEKQSNLNIDLDISIFDYSNYRDELRKKFFSGVDIDIFAYSRGLNNLKTLYHTEKIYDIVDYLPRYAPLLNERMYEQYPYIKQSSGEILMLPNMKQEQRIPTVYLEKSIAEKYEVTGINDFKEYTDLLVRINIDNPRIASGKVSQWRGGINLFANALGYTVFDEGLGIVYKSDDPRMRLLPWEDTDAFKKMVTLVDRWALYGCKVNDERDIASATYFTYSTEMLEGLKSVNYGDGVKDYYVYHVTGGKPIQRSNVFDKEFGGLCFMKKSKNIDKSLMFLEWAHENQKNYDLMNYGIKEKHYELEDGYINYLGDDKSDVFNLYAGWLNSPFLDKRYDRFHISKSKIPEYKKRYEEAIKQKIKIAPHEGFIPGQGDVLYGDQMQRRALYYEEVMNPLNKGRFIMGDLNEIQKMLDEEGTPAVLEDLQKQFDNWREK